MKKQLLFIALILIIFLVFCSIDKNPYIYISAGTHSRLGFRDLGWGLTEYEFRNVPRFAGLVTDFSWEEVRFGELDYLADSMKIECWIYTSVDVAELAMVERIEGSHAGFYNMIDYPLPLGQIGDNGWYNPYCNIRFIRNNVWVSLTSYGVDWSDLQIMARTIDSAIVSLEKVPSGRQVPAPVIHSAEATSSLPGDWGQSFTLKVNATDPNYQQLWFRSYAGGTRWDNNDGIFRITPKESSNIYASKDPNKFKVMIWVWNEDSLATLAVKEFPFRR
jgi:hypothetical protein